VCLESTGRQRRRRIRSGVQLKSNPQQDRPNPRRSPLWHIKRTWQLAKAIRNVGKYVHINDQCNPSSGLAKIINNRSAVF